MNEPDPLNQHPADEQRPPVCQACEGEGFCFQEVGVDSRVQVPCGTCGGSGSYLDSVARTLSGERNATKLDASEKRVYQWSLKKHGIEPAG